MTTSVFPIAFSPAIPTASPTPRSVLLAVASNPLEDGLVCRKTAAKVLGINPHTLAVWACTRRYPLPFVKIGSSVRYLKSDLAKFIADNTVRGATQVEVAR